jgi:hypothetical protein
LNQILLHFLPAHLHESIPISSVLQVIVACARLFMGDRKIDKARELTFSSRPLFFHVLQALGSTAP